MLDYIPLFSSQQLLVRRLKPAVETMSVHYSGWQKDGCPSEDYTVMTARPAIGRTKTPLRPELTEGTSFFIGQQMTRPGLVPLPIDCPR